MNPTWKKILGACTVAGPLAMTVGYLILMQRSGQGPDPGWFLSHIFLLIGAGTMLPAIVGIRFLLDPLRGGLADTGMVLAFIGAITLIGQFTIDLAVGQLAKDQPEMIALFHNLSTSPIIAFPFQRVGPVVFYAGLLVLMSLLWKERSIPRWASACAAAGIVGVGGGALTGIPVVTFIGFLGMSIGLMPAGWKLFKTARV